MLIRRFLASVGAFVDTWYPRIESDRDLPYDFAEALADKEAEEDVAEPVCSVEDLFKLRAAMWSAAPDPMHLLGFCDGGCPRYDCKCPPVSSLADVRESSEVDTPPKRVSPDTGAGVIPTPAPASTCKHCGQPIEWLNTGVWAHDTRIGARPSWRISCFLTTNATPK